MALSTAASWLGLLVLVLFIGEGTSADQWLQRQQQQQQPLPSYPYPSTQWNPDTGVHGATLGRDAFVNAVVANMTVEDLVLQLHLTFGDDIVGVESRDELYDYTMRFSPASAVGHMHDWYSLNTSHYNEVQQLNLDKARLKVPFMHFGECLHAVGSFKQSMFPQSLGLSASFDTDLVYRVGRAIGTEARSIGIHACFSPVLDIGQDPRWGRMQEAWGEDKVLTSHMGVAYSSGLSKNGSWSEPDAVVPVMKHFAAHGAPQAGRNAAPFMGHGNRQVFQDLLTPFKAVVQLGGVRGVMMSYNEFDDIPSHVNPKLYRALQDWGFDGFVIADDTGMNELYSVHQVASSPADAILQWYEAGGMIQFYDWPLELLLNTTKELIANGSLELSTLQSHVQSILGVKWDLGLFENPFISEGTDPIQTVQDNKGLALEASQRSIVLLENRDATLPLKPVEQNISTVALIGPFSDVLNYGDYSGQWGEYPADNANTIRQALLAYSENPEHPFKLVSSWGANTWEYNAQYVIPPYLLSSPDGTPGGLQVTYFATTNFSNPTVTRTEVPALDWGIYPPPGLPSNNFSAIWEGRLTSPVDVDTNGWIGVAVGANTTSKLFVNGNPVTSWGNPLTADNNILGNIQQFDYIQVNSTLPPEGSAPFMFRAGETYDIRIEYQAFNLYKKTENVVSLNSQLLLFWNLVSSDPADDAVSQAVQLAESADVIVLAVGAAWNSDGESGDRATLGLAPSQDKLATAIYALNKPVVLVLQGGRPFAIAEYYDQSAAVLSTWFPGQSGGQAIADVLFGKVNPGGRLPVSVPRHVGQIPIYYNYKSLGRKIKYLDVGSQPCYPFGYGLSFASFSVSDFTASSQDGGLVFTSGDTIAFSARVRNDGVIDGSYVLQVYVLGRVSSIVQPVKQLVAFQRVDVAAGDKVSVSMELEVDRYLTIINRWDEWVLEKGEYTFALLEHGGDLADTGLNVTMESV
ncbi:family 3 glycoside hydrolase [Cryphonectria parasitica EP155]|uniref:xylan 1,4-beta-xylosidase n=1 Tax=Cryphonectria parasitica (strain ATCC 38755 / EP155) TaxID=660469 RepID=A0A9P4Y4H4_CRYP1|nr:family 3 glycoside hydrolase [Cryphonectria parasitica EP155]KAF3766486.1 family 3 glycoside hydrolase [Cryphonectria parasitica EP155]